MIITSLSQIACSDSEKQDIQSAFITLYKTGSLMQSKRFLTLFHDETCRFDGNVSPLFARLRKDFLFQIHQSLSIDFLRGWQDSSRQPIPVEVAAPQMGRELVALANSIDDLHIKSTDKRFTVPRGESLLLSAFSTFNSTLTNQACIALSKIDSPYHSIRTFEARNVLSSLGVFVECLHTLAFETSWPRFESMIHGLFKDVDYFVNGYPCDILVHDVRALREGKKVSHILAHKDYCSTQILDSASDLPTSKNHTLFAM